jgi:shikimate dehydrogenase
MHNALYKRLGLPWEYGVMDCADKEQAQRFLDKRGFLGLNVTTPYKPTAFQAATLKGASAKLARGANVLVCRGEALIAYNKDGEGCVSYLERQGFSFRGASVAVCGTGPTALAILHAAACAGAQGLALVGRSEQRAAAALKAYREEFKAMAYATIELPALREGHRSFREAYDEAKFTSGSYDSVPQLIAEADLVVDATTLGMKAGDASPFDTALLQEHQTVYDVVYGQAQTALVTAAREKGCRAFDGRGMLVAQAVASATAFFEVSGIETDATEDEMFAIMARAAGFEC